MSSKKIIIIAIIILVLSILGYLLFSWLGNLKSSNEKIYIPLIILEDEIISDNSKKDEIINVLTKMFAENSKGLEIDLITNSEHINKTVEYPIGITRIDLYEKMIDSSFSELLNSIKDINIDNEDVNRLLESLAQRIGNNPDKNIVAVLTGNFPLCYDSVNAYKALDVIDDKLINETEDINFKIAWCVFSRSGRPENIIINHLDSIYDLDNKQITANLGDCLSNDGLNTHIDFYIFSSIDKTRIDKIINQVKKLHKGSAHIKIMTKEKKFEISFQQKDSLDMTQYLRDQLSKAKKVDINTSRFILKSFIDSHSTDKDSLDHSVFIVGSMPYTSQKLVDIKPLKDKNNLVLYLDIDMKKKGIDAQQIYIDAFRAINIDVKPIQ